MLGKGMTPSHGRPVESDMKRKSRQGKIIYVVTPRPIQMRRRSGPAKFHEILPLSMGEYKMTFYSKIIVYSKAISMSDCCANQSRGTDQQSQNLGFQYCHVGYEYLVS